MKLCAALLLGFWALVSSIPAVACSFITETWIHFPFESANVADSTSAQRAFETYKKSFGALNPACVNFSIKGASDTEEAGPSEGRIVAERIEAVRRGLLELGFSSDRIDIGRPVINPTPPAKQGIINVPDRSVRVDYRYSKGRYRCDPSTKYKDHLPGCAAYGACYLELVDGTVCNVNNVPDPRPGRYSVSPSGEPLQ